MIVYGDSYVQLEFDQFEEKNEFVDVKKDNDDIRIYNNYIKNKDRKREKIILQVPKWFAKRMRLINLLN